MTKRGFFPIQTGKWQAFELPPMRRMSASLAEMAVITGVLLHVYRAVVLSRAEPGGWLYAVLSLAFGLVLLCGMATLHLGNYTVRTWVWRAPVFAVAEAAAESAMALLLIALQLEPMGTSRAVWADWPAISARLILFRLLAVCLFALVLAGVLQVVRVVLGNTPAGQDLEAAEG